MTDGAREVWITGVGIASCIGEGADAHWQGLCERRTSVDVERFAPYPVHPLAALDFDKQIPKKGDQRQMEAWQRIGTYAAGLALESAGVKGQADMLSRLDMIVLVTKFQVWFGPRLGAGMIPMAALLSGPSTVLPGFLGSN